MTKFSCFSEHRLCSKPLQYGCLQTPLDPKSQDSTFKRAQIMVPILQSPGEPERAGEARRADSASNWKTSTVGLWLYNSGLPKPAPAKWWWKWNINKIKMWKVLKTATLPQRQQGLHRTSAKYTHWNVLQQFCLLLFSNQKRRCLCQTTSGSHESCLAENQTCVKDPTHKSFWVYVSRLSTPSSQEVAVWQEKHTVDVFHPI